MSDSPHDDGVRGRSKSVDSRKGASPRDRSASPRGGEDRRRRDRDADSATQVYVAKLHRNTREGDLRDSFSKFGKIKEIVMKHNYAFIGYEDPEAASVAVKEMNGKSFVNGEELVVE